MKQEFKKHGFAYLILFFGLLTIIISFFYAWPNRVIQRFIALILAFFYFIWGVLSHLHDEVLSHKVVYEYLAVALLSGAVVLLITL